MKLWSEGLLNEMPDSLENFGVSEYDLATRDKIPLITGLMPRQQNGMALDIGAGTGFTTRSVFGAQPIVCVDVDPANLEFYRSRIDQGDALCVLAAASALPFVSGCFSSILCSEVLEHLEDDDAAVGEIARVLAGHGTAVITVPYTGLGFPGFLELVGIKTVHDFPGPERHVRPGYDEHSLGELLGRHGLEVSQYAFYLHLFTKLAVDSVSLAHLVYQRVVHRRRAWTWSDASGLENSRAFTLFRRVFPLIRAFTRLDWLVSGFRGFGLAASIRKAS